MPQVYSKLVFIFEMTADESRADENNFARSSRLHSAIVVTTDKSNVCF